MVGRQTKTIVSHVGNVPKEDVDLIRPYAQRNGHAAAVASVIRFAVVELAKRLRAEQEQHVEQRAVVS